MFYYNGEICETSMNRFILYDEPCQPEGAKVVYLVEDVDGKTNK